MHRRNVFKNPLAIAGRFAIPIPAAVAGLDERRNRASVFFKARSPVSLT
jgi:hypothetical protein